MRVSPRDLRAVQRDGLLTRFAILGPVAFAIVELGGQGSAGSALEQPTDAESWGFVLQGELTLHASQPQALTAGTAFYVPAGPPAHSFSASGRVVAAGFAPVRPDLDASDDALRAAGWTPARSRSSTPLPKTIQPLGPTSRFRPQGSIEVELAQMGSWVFARNTFGPLSGFATGWCDLPHWGIVLSGDLALAFEDDVELLTAGDIYYCPPGPPGHQIRVADAATTIDYTPLQDMQGSARRSEWRRQATRRLAKVEATPGRPGKADAPVDPQAPDVVGAVGQSTAKVEGHR
jgi:quercetin dioxygenase-like cupin family protein